MLTSSVCCSTCMFTLALVTWIIDDNKDDTPAWVRWLPLVLLVAFTVAYLGGLGPVPWVLIGELLSGNKNAERILCLK